MEGPLQSFFIFCRLDFKHGRHRQYLFLIGRNLKKSPQKQLGQMNCNLVGMMYGRSSTKLPFFLLIGLQIWPPWAILVSDWSKFKKSSPQKQLDQMNCNLVGMMYGRSSTKLQFFQSIGLQTWLPQAILVSDWSKLKKSSPQKLLGQMNCNLVGMMYGRSSTKLPFFLLIRLQTWLPLAILVSDWSKLKKIFSSETTAPNEL